MDETIICSKKINLFKKIKIAWIVIAVILVAVTVFSVIKYSDYKKAQETAVEFITSITNYYDNYNYDYNTLVEEIYDDIAFDYTKEKALAELMTSAGYDCNYGSKYLKHIGFVDYAVNETLVPFIIGGALALLLGILNLCYYIDAKKEMIIDTDRIVCKSGKKTTKEFMVKDIKSVELASMKGLMIRGNGFKYKINLLSNAEELKTTIMDSLATLLAENVATTEIKQEILPSNADELKKYKELLDAGIITQEEFDAKKKQLLGL